MAKAFFNTLDNQIVQSLSNENFDNSGDNTLLGLQTLGSAIKGAPIGFTYNSQSTAPALATGLVYFMGCLLPKPGNLVGIKCWMQTVGNYTANNYNGVGLYSFTPVTGLLTLLGSSTNNGNIWKAATGFPGNVIPFSAVQIGLAAGVYFSAMLYNSSAQVTAPAVYGNVLSNINLNLLDFGAGIKISGALAGQTALPASILLSAIGGSNQPYYTMLY